MHIGTEGNRRAIHRRAIVTGKEPLPVRKYLFDIIALWRVFLYLLHQGVLKENTEILRQMFCIRVGSMPHQVADGVPVAMDLRFLLPVVHNAPKKGKDFFVGQFQVFHYASSISSCLALYSAICFWISFASSGVHSLVR